MQQYRVVASCAESRHPVSQEHVRGTAIWRMTVGLPNQLSPVRTKHREAIEFGVRSHLFETRTVGVHEVQIEVAATRILVIRREDDATPIGREKGSEVGTAKVRDLMLAAAIGVHDPD